MALRSPIINVMTSAAQRTARQLTRDFGEVEQLQVSRKGPSDFVTIADLKAEKALRDALSRSRPGYGFLLEEQGAVAGDDPRHRWIVDPLDGTTNFLHGIPHFAISIALERDGEIVSAVIYHPVADEMYWAEKGVGAFLNDRRIRVSSRSDMGDALLATGIPFRGVPRHAEFLSVLETVMPQVAGVRRFGSAALDLAYIAAGRYDGFWEFGLKPWDIAAGLLIVQEAGGFVSAPNGRDDVMVTGDIVAANGNLHVPLRDLVRDAAAAAASEIEPGAASG